MEEIDWSDRAFYDDGEWVTWSEIDEQLRYKEWGAKYPNAIRSMIPYFEDLLSLAESYHLETGLHLSVYGDHVEVKTITPFKTKDVVVVDTNGHFNKLLVVKINEDFQVSGRMIDRKDLPKREGRYLRVRWGDLPTPK